MTGQRITLRKVTAIAEAADELNDALRSQRPTTGNAPYSEIYGHWDAAVRAGADWILAIAELQQYCFQRIDAKGKKSLPDIPFESDKQDRVKALIETPRETPPD